ncbi:MAG: hypothetical protein ACD_40C00043G0002 [uncultured bacterium]|nr:MAG: hypothetical protein ACD_40C00043G0002 [uncultured bacterium]KKU14401.1 MAG: hypothetical protein UX21_C0020G0006 [Microgenomates group bacterium GW2011_GWC2_45_8]KKU25510.1 MAG: hypothetical protein UX37_C0020G0010 [Microgenomates group bacterium GW2011_GWA2_46_16]
MLNNDWFHAPGYKNLLVYKLSKLIFDLNSEFCDLFIDKRSRTHDQMIQAARSSKQNIVEGSLEKSLKSYIKLVGVSRASFEELVEDYHDYLRLNKLVLWEKTEPRVGQIRAIRFADSDLSNWPNWANSPNLAKKPEEFANLQITLIKMECYLLDKLLRTLEEKFIHEGGYTENLFKKRLSYRNNNGY